MPKNENQKLKLYYLYRIMLEQTDEEHGLSMQDILTELAERGITCERKSIYRDFKVLTENMGLEIIGEQVGSNYYYHVGQKQFELAELKLLVDSVQASKFISSRSMWIWLPRCICLTCSSMPSGIRWTSWQVMRGKPSRTPLPTRRRKV